MKITIDLPDEPIFFRGIPCPVTIELNAVMPKNDLAAPDGKILSVDPCGTVSLCSGDFAVNHRHGIAPIGHGDIQAGKWAWLITRGLATVKTA